LDAGHEVSATAFGKNHWKQVDDEDPPQNIARMLAGSGPLFEPLMGIATALFSRGSLSPIGTQRT
jgi:hypothetical protein